MVFNAFSEESADLFVVLAISTLELYASMKKSTCTSNKFIYYLVIILERATKLLRHIGCLRIRPICCDHTCKTLVKRHKDVDHVEKSFALWWSTRRPRSTGMDCLFVHTFGNLLANIILSKRLEYLRQAMSTK